MNELAIVVMSCDAFEDVWDGFFTLFKRYWPDCPFPVYFCTDSKACPDPGVIALTPGKQLPWSYRLRYSLEQITQPYVLFLQDDFFFIKPTDTALLIDYVNIMKKEKAGMFRVFPCPGATAPLPGYSDIGSLPPGMPYRVSCQSSIWDRQVLSKLLVDEESIWAFEEKGSQRSNQLSAPFIGVFAKDPQRPKEEQDYAINYFCTAVLKGKWMRGVLELNQKEQLNLDFSRRPVETPWEVRRRAIYEGSPAFAKKYMWYLLFKLLK